MTVQMVRSGETAEKGVEDTADEVIKDTAEEAAKIKKTVCQTDEAAEGVEGK